MTMPDNIAISKCLLTIANNLTLLLEFQNNFNAIVDANHAESTSVDAKTAISDSISMASYIAEHHATLLPKLWDGTISSDELASLMPGYFTFQETMAQKALAELDPAIRAEKLSQVRMVYSIDKDSNFVRAYESNGKQLQANDKDDQKVINVLDQSFHAWLLKNNLLSIKGVIYKNTKYLEGKPTEKVDPAELIALFNDPEKGLPKKQENICELQVQQFKQQPELTNQSHAIASH